jgi:cytochrome P450
LIRHFCGGAIIGAGIIKPHSIGVGVITYTAQARSGTWSLPVGEAARPGLPPCSRSSPTGLAFSRPGRDRRPMIDVEAPTVVFNPFSPEFRDDPYPSYGTMRDAGPVIRTPFGSLMVTRYELVDRVLRSSAFRTPRGYRDANDPAGPPRFDPAGPLSLHRRHWLLFQSGDAHVRLRKLVTKVFTPRAVRALVPRIEGLVDALLAPALERGSMEVIGELAYPLPATVICELLGVPEVDREQNRAWAAAIAPTLDPFSTEEQITAAEAAMRGWDAYTRELMAERRRKPAHALLDDMLAVEEDGTRLTSDEIAANTTFLFLAGHETTTNLIGNGLLARRGRDRRALAVRLARAVHRPRRRRDDAGRGGRGRGRALLPWRSPRPR